MARTRPLPSVDWISWALLAVMVAVSAVAWSKVPDQLPVHWNLQGQADSFASRDFALAVLPLVGAALMLLFWLLCRGLPVQESPRLTRAVRTLSRGVLGLFVVLHVAIVLASLGGQISVPRVALGGSALLIVLVGLTMRSLPPDRVAGVRLPAGLAARPAWRSTHRLAAKLLIALGALTLAASLLPVALQTGVLIVGLLAVAAVLVASMMRLKERALQSRSADLAEDA